MGDFYFLIVTFRLKWSVCHRASGMWHCDSLMSRALIITKGYLLLNPRRTVHRLELDSWLSSTSRSFDAPHFCSSLSRSNPLRSGSATSSKLNTAPSYVNGCRKLHPLLTFSLWPRRSCRQSLLRQNLPPWWIQLTKFAQCHSTLLKYAISKLDDFSPPLLPAFSKLLPLSLIVSFSGKLPDF